MPFWKRSKKSGDSKKDDGLKYTSMKSPVVSGGRVILKPHPALDFPWCAPDYTGDVVYEGKTLTFVDGVLKE